MIRSRSPKRPCTFACRYSSQRRAICSSTSAYSAATTTSCPSARTCSSSARRSVARSISILISSSVLITADNDELVVTNPGSRRRRAGSRFRPRPQRRSRSRSAEDPLGVAELVEPVFVESEVVRELVENGDTDLAAQLGGVGERGLERAAVDHDLRRKRARRHRLAAGIPGEDAEDLRALRVFVLDDDGHVLEPARDLLRQRGGRGPDDLLELLVGHQ